MRTPKEVIGLARRSGAKRLEIAFVDAVGVSRQFTCPVTQLGETPGERFDNSAEALTSSFWATTAGLDREIFRSGSLTVDLTRRLVSVAGKSVKLSVTEYSLLQLLVRNAGLVVSYAQMLREVWGEEMLEKVNYLRVYFVALRKKLETPSEPGLFLTERSVGYRLVVR